LDFEAPGVVRKLKSALSEPATLRSWPFLKKKLKEVTLEKRTSTSFLIELGVEWCRKMEELNDFAPMDWPEE
jgi:hypothetical protein